MKKQNMTASAKIAVVSCAILSCTNPLLFAQGESLKTDLVSYWPLDVVEGNSTPDLANGLDLLLFNMSASDLVEGKFGQGFQFTAARNTYLARTSTSEEDLPANKNTSFTISFWAKVSSVGQSDLRLFSEGSDVSDDPLFTLGTRNGTDANSSVDLFVRHPGTTEINHLRTTAEPLDGVDWRHITFVQELQDDGTGIRQIYIDGMLDALEIPAKQDDLPFNMNVTALGAVVRGGDAAHLTGQIDELVIWKRALIPAEINDLITNGMPSLEVVQEDLEITSFTSDFSRVPTGGQVLLSWDVTSDATINISPTLGDVTAMSDFGVGSTLVTINEPTTFTLTASRGVETPLEQEVSITNIDDVSTGWNWIEDFQDYNFGFLEKQGGWLDVIGDFEITDVIDVEGTRILITEGGGDLSARPLGRFGIANNSSATLFFRFCYDEPIDQPIDLKVGLTEKAFRAIEDWTTNIGTYVTFSRESGGQLRLLAIDGIGGTPVDSGITFVGNASYDVWIDIVNNPLDQTDRFSVHIGFSGEERTTVFDNFASDRSPDDVPLLGSPREDIDSLFLVAQATGQDSAGLALDDFYISTAGTFLETAPVASSLGKVTPVPDPKPFVVTTFTYDPITRRADLEWNSLPDKTYAIFASENLQVWGNIKDSIATEGATTGDFVILPESTSSRFFIQVREE